MDQYKARPTFTLNARQFSLELGRRTAIMGVVNLTPDSFSQDGCLNDPGSAIEIAKRMVEEGADIIDIGGESSRPGAAQVSAEEEVRRIIPTVTQLANFLTVPISVDTYKPSVAQAALKAGASIINNIEGAAPNEDLLKAVRDYDAAIVLMHMRGTPPTMQKDIFYTDIIDEITQSLQKSAEICLEIGIKSDKIIIDPGIGFGKTGEHNLEIIRKLKNFHVLNHPILIGTSRKSFIGNILGQDVTQRVLGTAATVCAGVLNGAHIVRVHDVKEMKQITLMADAIAQEEHAHV